MAIEIKRLNHIAYSVKDIEETKQWYIKVFGATTVLDYDPDKDSKHMKLLMPCGFEIELFEYEEPISEECPFPTFTLPYDH